MKAVLISIQPKWCELIASGKKTVEVRKTRPKLETPFKCYIYCTNAKGQAFFTKGENGNYAPARWGNGKVIGEFVCDKIYDTYKMFICEYGEDMTLPLFKEKSCVSGKELDEYAKGLFLYGWHISDLVIYDKPRELGEFYQVGKSTDFAYYDYCSGCPYHETPVSEYPCNECDGNRKYLYRPPRSWSYVERSENGN